MSNLPQSELFLWEAFDLISNTTILGVLFGIAFTLYCLCARSLYLQLREPDNQRQARFGLAYTSLVFLCTMIYLALSTRTSQLAYINHADFPGGPLEYELSYNPTTKSYETATGVFNLVVNVMTMAIQIWRLLVIWSGTQYTLAVMILPLLLLLSFIALSVPTSIVVGLLPLDRLGISNRSEFAMDTASYAILAAFTVFVTGLVTGRLLQVRRRHIREMGTSKTPNPYLSIVAILVESYALESAWSIATAISNGIRRPSFLLFVTNDSTIKVIAYFLVIYHVASGRGWTRETEGKLTSLQWNRGTQTTPGEVSGIHDRVPATSTMVAVGSPPISQSASTI